MKCPEVGGEAGRGRRGRDCRKERLREERGGKFRPPMGGLAGGYLVPMPGEYIKVFPLAILDPGKTGLCSAMSRLSSRLFLSGEKYKTIARVRTYYSHAFLKLIFLHLTPNIRASSDWQHPNFVVVLRNKRKIFQIFF